MQTRLPKHSELSAKPSAVAVAAIVCASFSAGYWLSVSTAEPRVTVVPSCASAVAAAAELQHAEDSGLWVPVQVPTDSESSELPSAATTSAAATELQSSNDPLSSGLN